MGTSTGGGDAGGSDGDGGVPLPVNTGWDVSAIADGVKDGGKISGTNVRVTPTTLLKWHDSPENQNYFSSITVVACDLYLGGYGTHELVDSETLNKTYPTPARGTDPFTIPVPSKTVAFASTHFPPDKPVDIWVEVGIFFFDPTAIAPIFPEIIQTEVKPVAYNKGLTLSSNLVTGDGPPYVITGDPESQGPQTVTAVSHRTAADARRALVGLKHSLVSSNDELTKAALQNDLKRATVFFGNTHGSANSLITYAMPGSGALYDRMTFFDPDDGTPGDIPKAMMCAADVPGPNMVIMHSCGKVPDWTSEGSLTKAYQAFFGPDLATAIPDTAYAGFPVTVFTQLYEDGGHLFQTAPFLDTHAVEVYAQLSYGLTITESLKIANKGYPPVLLDTNTNTYMTQPMRCSGDVFARLTHVYTAADPIDPDTGQPKPPTAWYRVLP